MTALIGVERPWCRIVEVTLIYAISIALLAIVEPNASVSVKISAGEVEMAVVYNSCQAVCIIRNIKGWLPLHHQSIM